MRGAHGHERGGGPAVCHGGAAQARGSTQEPQGTRLLCPAAAAVRVPSAAAACSCPPASQLAPSPHRRHSPRPALQVLAESLGWMAEVVPEFGLGACDVKGIIEWMKADLGSPNAPGEARGPGCCTWHGRGCCSAGGGMLGLVALRMPAITVPAGQRLPACSAHQGDGGAGSVPRAAGAFAGRLPGGAQARAAHGAGGALPPEPAHAGVCCRAVAVTGAGGAGAGREGA